MVELLGKALMFPIHQPFKEKNIMSSTPTYKLQWRNGNHWSDKLTSNNGGAEQSLMIQGDWSAKSEPDRRFRLIRVEQGREMVIFIW